jgi:anti-anti-sigma regulatory factor
MFKINIDKNDDSTVVRLEGKATIDHARDLKSHLLNLVPETDHLIIDASLLEHGDLSFFQIIISTFRDMHHINKKFTFISNTDIKVDAFQFFGDFSIAYDLLRLEPARLREIIYGQ